MRSRLIIVALLAALGAIVTFWWIGRSPIRPEVVLERAPATPAPVARVLAPSEQKARLAAAVPQLPASRLLSSAWQSEPGAEFAEFRTWTDRYLAADDPTRRTLLPEGLARARARRPAMAQLIRQDPERALADAVPIMVRRQLPPEIEALLEKRVSGPGELALRGALAIPGATLADPTYRTASVGGQDYRAYTYGRRARAGTIENASIHGVALDGALAVSDSPVRILEPGETPEGKPVEEVCVVSGKTTPVTAASALNLPTADPARSPVAVELNGKIQISCEASHVKLMTEQVLAEELANEEHNAADGGPGSSTVVGRPTSAWTHGTKKVLIIIVDFADKAGVPTNPTDSQSITKQYVLDRFNLAGGVKDFYDQNSYNATSLSITSADVTNVLRMPKNASYYAQTEADTELHSDARAKAAAAGFVLNNYDRIGVVFPDLSNINGVTFQYAGLANVIGKNFWINGSFDFRVVAHEIGHNYGLNHANLWKVTDGNPVSNSGTSQEYGDPFDTMGLNGTITTHFSHWNKSILQWIPDASVTTVSTTGIYRIFKFDPTGTNLPGVIADPPSHPLAVKVVRDSTRDYWIGHRRATTNAALDNGAYVLWGYNDNRQGNLLDLNTPNSNLTDSALQVGSTFNDAAAGIAFQTVARGGSGNDEFIDLQVTFSPHISFSDPLYVTDERAGSAKVTLVRGGSSAGAVSVQYATAPGTATSPADFTATSGTVSWAAGDTSPKVISIPIVGDSVVESPSEDFSVLLSNPTGGAVADPSPATVRIVDAGLADSGFGADFTDNTVNQVIVEPDGRILACGYFDLVQTSGYVIYSRGGITRYNASGATDASFSVAGGPSGGSTIDSATGQPFPVVYAMARQPDGKIVIGGDFDKVDGVARLNIARLNSDGSLDTTFNPGTGANLPVHAVLVQANGKIMIGGEFSSFNGTARTYLARLNANGSLDAGFLNVAAFTAQTNYYIEALAQQTDGMILAAGNVYAGTSPQFKFGIHRVTSVGTLDTNFNGVTFGATPAGNTTTSARIHQVAVQPDGKIIIVGEFGAFNNVARGGIARLLSTGALDTNFTATTNGEVGALLVQPDGNILIGGTFTTLNGTPMKGIGRLNSSGGRDTTFAPGSGNGPSELVKSFAMGADGRIVFGGDYGTFQSQPGAGPLWRFVPGISGLPGIIQLTTATSTALEGSTLTLTASRTGGSTGAVTVSYATVGGTAVSNTDYTNTVGNLTWADGDGANKTINIPITVDALADDGETLTLNLGQAALNSPVMGATQQSIITIRDGFQSWQKTKFTTAELGQPSVSGDLAAPAFDGLNNLQKYGLGLAPKVPATAANRPAPGKVNVSGSDYLTLSFRRLSPAAPDLTYTVQNAGTTTGPWGTSTIQVGTATSNGDGTETVTFRDNVPITSTTQRYLRLEIDRVP